MTKKRRVAALAAAKGFRALTAPLAERLNSLVTQSDGIALSSPGELDDRFGYHCHCGIIAIDQTQVTDCIFKCLCEHRDSVWPKDFLFSLGGVRKRHFTIRELKHAPAADGQKIERRYQKLKICGAY